MLSKKNVIISVFILLNSFFLAAQNKNNLPIGVFDSGTGGLTVLQAMLTLDAFNNTTGIVGADGKPDFEKEIFQYLADQANMPYGNYAAEQKTDLLKEHILKNMDFLLNNLYAQNAVNNWKSANKSPVKMIVIACNTATAYALEDIRKQLKYLQKNIACIGVIEAGAKAAILQQKKTPGSIGVFATAGTVASNGYPKALIKMGKEMGLGDLQIVSQGGVGLAESIDRDWSFFV
ncbi:MAG: glutamate racemase, partial [Chitinophagaceae bacterium]